METYIGKETYICDTEDELILLDQFFKVESFNLKAFHELEAFFLEPEPYLEIELTSAAVIPFIEGTNNILLVETEDSSMEKRIELPAGKVDEQDNDIFNTAIREFIEETGLLVNREDLKPFMTRYHKDGNGGLQFLTEISISKLREGKTDEYGRTYYYPIENTDGGRTIRLISEPLDIFLNSDLTLLKFSKHPWAIDDSVRATLGLIGERRLEKIKKKGSFLGKFLNKKA